MINILMFVNLINNLRKILFKKNIFILFLFLVLSFNPLFSRANKKDIINQANYPKIANYFLSWSLTDKNVQELAKWDFLILDMENQINNPEKIRKIRELNPNIVILAYVPIEEIAYDSVNREYTQLREKLAEHSPENWYLHNFQGNRLSFWEKSLVINITDQASLKDDRRWNTFLPEFVTDQILSIGLWDGVFYDNTSASISWVSSGNIDLNNDGRAENDFQVDTQWKAGAMKILRLTREANSNFIIIGNSASDLDFQEYLNGRMFETFPSPWEGGGDWSYVTDLYLNQFPEKSLDPQVYVINSNTENTGVMDNYRKMRFGLITTLLGKGYYSFDFGDQSHTQTWWYDEYESFLGNPQAKAYNLLDKENQNIKPSLWRRDFENGTVILNSTEKEQTYIFLGEDFEKINGNQDRRVNNGSKINWLKIAPRDGIVLLKTNKNIVGANYFNGSFVRIFNINGQQERNGFFAYEDGQQGNIEILKTDLNGDGKLETLVNGNGKITIYEEGEEKKDFYPYTENFKEHISFAVADLNNDGNKEIITGAGPGGGPHVRVFNKDGELINPGWFAYNKNFLGGISVAVADLNNDGELEIITGAGLGGSPHVRVFNKNGELINQFFAYDSNFYGGISVTAGDVNNDGIREIITSPGRGGNSQVKIFTQYGHLLNDFFAYNYQSNVSTRVVSNDIDNDGVDEILVSINNF
jgi:hypothetical protein